MTLGRVRENESRIGMNEMRGWSLARGGIDSEEEKGERERQRGAAREVVRPGAVGDD
jgi:hypothetical protein